MSERYGFRTGFRGFSRQDVLNYIDDIRTTFHEETTARDAEIESLKTQLNDLREKLALASTAEEREAQLRAELETAQEAVRSLTVQTEQLTAQLAQAQATIDSGREQELAESLAEARSTVQTLREREATLTSQLAETHQAVAALWQEKEQLEHGLTAAAAFADSVQAQAADLKAQLGGAAVPDEKPAEKSMERWLF